jgi:hypothetical protein
MAHDDTHIRQHFERENAALLEKIPEWKSDPARAKKEFDALKGEMIARYGFSPQDLAVIPDHRHVLIARDAVAAAQAKKGLEERDQRLADHSKRLAAYEQADAHRRKGDAADAKRKRIEASRKLGTIDRAQALAAELDREDK